MSGIMPEKQPAFEKEFNLIKSNLDTLKSKIPTEPTTQGYNKSDLTVLECSINMFVKLISDYNAKLSEYNNWVIEYNLTHQIKYKYLTPYPQLQNQDLDENGIFSKTPATFVFTG